VLVRVDRQAHRHALHYLHPVAAGVLRRQHRELAAGGRADALHRGVPHHAGIAVHAHRGLLADAHVREVGFLQVRLHPRVLHVHQAEQRLPGIHHVTGAKVFHLCHYAVHGRAHLRAVQVHLRLIALRGRLLIHGDAFERRVHVAAQDGRHLAHGLHGRLGALACCRQLVLGLVVGGARGEAAHHQILLALQLALVVIDVHVRLRQVRRALAVRGAQRGNLSDHVVDVGFGLGERDAVGAAADLQQRLAGLDLGVLVHGDAEHPATYLRADADLRRLHVGVVGARVALAAQVEIRAAGGDHHDAERKQRPAQALASRRRAGGLGGVLGDVGHGGTRWLRQDTSKPAARGAATADNRRRRHSNADRPTGQPLGVSTPGGFIRHPRPFVQSRAARDPRRAVADRRVTSIISGAQVHAIARLSCARTAPGRSRDAWRVRRPPAPRRRPHAWRRS
jgi:hypothetical protein